jgi:recombinational DNA repair protein (RecF pathway)
MSHKFPEAEARKLLSSFNFEPIGEYPGKRKPWKSKCTKCGYEAAPILSNLEKGLAGCANCAGLVLSTSRLNEVTERAQVIPLVDYPGKGKPWKCKCKLCGEVVTPTYGSMRQGRMGCKSCAMKKSAQSRKSNPFKPTAQMGKRISNEEATSFMVAAGLVPQEEYVNYKHLWKCKCMTCGKHVQIALMRVKSQGRGCPECGKSRKGASQKHTPYALNQILKDSSLKLVGEYKNSHSPTHCICLKCGKDVYPSLVSLSRGSGGCLYCAGQHVDPIEAEKVLIAAKIKPLVAYPGNNKPWKSVCLVCKKEIAPYYRSIRQGGGCEWCQNRKVDPNERADIMRLADLEPLEPYPGALSPWRSRCINCQREVNPWFHTILRGGVCGYCNGTIVDPKDAEAIMLAASLKPLEPFTKSEAPWKSQCLKCSEIVFSSFHTVKGGSACRYCANRGFQPNKESIVYLVVNELFKAAKIGIMNVGTSRIRDHQKNGWFVLHQVEVPGKLAMEIESSILLYWRDELRLPIYMSPESMPQAGYTETVSLDGLEIEDTINSMNMLAAG